MTIQDELVSQQLLAALAAVPALRTRREDLGGRPVVGSTAHGEVAHSLCQFAWVQASTAVAVAIDNINAWRLLLTDARTQPFSAHYTLLRACLEAAVTARWICDAEADSVERAARGIAVQRESFLERSKFERGASKDLPDRTGPARSGDSRVAILERAQRRWAIPRRELNIVELHRLFAQPKRDALPGDLLFRLLSGFAHGRDWVHLAMSTALKNQAPGQGRPGAALLTAGGDLTVYATMVAVWVTEAAVSDLERYGVTPR